MKTMYDLIYGLPDELKDGWQAAEAVALPRLPRPRQVVISGMGGSAIGGDILQGLLLARSPLPITTVRDYSLPRSVDRETLFFAVSFSGNTEETIAAYQQAVRVKCPRVVVSSGGRLTALARENRDTRPRNKSLMRGWVTPQWVAASACFQSLALMIAAICRISSARAWRLAACSGVSAIASHTLLKALVLVIGYLSSVR